MHATGGTLARAALLTFTCRFACAGYSPAALPHPHPSITHLIRLTPFYTTYPAQHAARGAAPHTNAAHDPCHRGTTLPWLPHFLPPRPLPPGSARAACRRMALYLPTSPPPPPPLAACYIWFFFCYSCWTLDRKNWVDHCTFPIHTPCAFPLHFHCAYVLVFTPALYAIYFCTPSSSAGATPFHYLPTHTTPTFPTPRPHHCLPAPPPCLPLFVPL